MINYLTGAHYYFNVANEVVAKNAGFGKKLHAAVVLGPTTKAMKAVDACSEKFKGRLPRELFTEDGSELLRRKLSACLALYSPAKEPLYPCSSEVGVTITAHCIKAELFEMASIKNKYRILVLVDEFVECMAQELGHPLAILRSAVEGTR
ncbi:uncharacterized protein LOC142590979 isoform X1 [Dermacentor variabilis]|uniref:uncharacterized protein LOC142590979 isoform X1 n=1 Tax=Dermacentor variabilis TaxID=34621 RepID=UPI003F5C3813